MTDLPSPESRVPSPVFSAIDHAMMARALRLAERGLFTTQPNPRVGCVIARGDEILGEGWHQCAGEPHAEVFALRAAGEHARGATAYVTLEPCSHHGRTPPCADALIEAGIARVVVACEDSNPKAGAGLQWLRDAGIVVDCGVMRDAARELNRGFFSRFERGRPWVRVKLAMSLDGRTALANGESKWITGDAARADVQRWRARSSAILTGAGTARADDPRLTVRLRDGEPHPRPNVARFGVLPHQATQPSASCFERSSAHEPSARNAPTRPLEGEGLQPRGDSALLLPLQGEGRDGDGVAAEGFQPLRVVLDARLDALSVNAHLLDSSAPTLVLHAHGAQPQDDRYRQVELADVAVDSKNRLDLAAALQLLAARGTNELQVEAGPALCGALFEENLIDELLLYVAPTFLGDSAQPLLTLPALASMSERRTWRVLDRRMVGPDQRLLLRPAAL